MILILNSKKSYAILMYLLHVIYFPLLFSYKEFLDIACFFKRETRDDVTKILDGCGFSSDIGISVLIDKSLVSISNDRVSMHDLVQEMGREIVRQESPEEPGNRSRLLQHKDIYHVLTNETVRSQTQK